MNISFPELSIDGHQRHTKRQIVIIALSLLWAQTGLCAKAGITAAEFAAQAMPVLPIEQPYDFKKAFENWVEPVSRDPAAKPLASEMAIPDTGWAVLIPVQAGPVLKQAAEDFRAYLGHAMQVQVALDTQTSLGGWQALARAIIAGTRDQLPGCSAELQGRKDYQIIVTPERVTVCGYDERGAMYGLYNLEARMNLREGPFLPRDLNTTRHSLYSTRLTLSGLGYDQWPDAYLAALAHYGIDAIYASAYENPNGYPNPKRLFYHYANQDPARLHDLIHRAARYGIDLYCPIIWVSTGEPENTAGLRMLVRDIVRTFPEIRGYVLLNEGFTPAGRPGRDESVYHQREWIEQWTRAIAIVAEECHRINPAIEVLAWDYGVDTRPYPDKIDTKRFVIDQYPRDVIPLITWENGKRFERDGQPGWVQDYSISEVGPAECAAAQIDEARKRGMKVYAKADTWASWQFGTFPYLPFPYQWYERYRMLEKYGVQGTLESWSYGFKPNFVAELRAWYSWSGAPPLDDLLRGIARREFGPDSADLVLSAWDHFSKAVRLLPDTGGSIGTTVAVAQPFFFDKPTRPRTRTLENSWNNQTLWMQDSGINPYWPYVFERWYLLWPDFTNQVNVAELYTRPVGEKNGPYFTLPVFMKYLLQAADEMEAGLVGYRQAALRAPEPKRYGAFCEVLLAEQIERMLRSDQAMLEFEDLRFRLGKAAAPEEGQMLDRMCAILKEEIERSTAARETASRDSRLGYEWEHDYFYTPDTLAEKIQQVRTVLDREIPAFRKQHGLE